MYFSRIFLNPARRGSTRLLSSPQRLHAAVLASFPPHDPTATPGRVLWRADTTNRQRTELLLVSPQRPDLTHIIEQAGWPTLSTWDCADYAPLLNSLKPGQKWAFRLHANVTKYVKFPGATRGKPVGLITLADQQQWLIDRAATSGFTVSTPDQMPQFSVGRTTQQRFNKGNHETTTHRVSLNVVTYDGVLEVTDVDAIRQVLTTGLGRARGYGCGLLTLARL